MTFSDLETGAEFTFDRGSPWCKDKPMTKIAKDAYLHYDETRRDRELLVHDRQAPVTVW